MPTWSSQKDPTLAGRRSLNDFRYATFFWFLVAIGAAAVVANAIAGRAHGIVGGLLIVASGFSVRQAGRVRRDEIDRKYLAAYGAEIGFFVLGVALLFAGAYLARAG
jgi:hypothetical protein